MRNEPTASTADKPAREQRSSRSAVARRVAAAAAAALLLVLAVVGAWLYGRGGGALPPLLGRFAPAGTDVLAPSSPEERVLRTLRLAGVERVVVGSSGGTVVARLELPSVRTSADTEFAVQAGFSAMCEAYPRAESYVVQLFAPGAVPLLEARAKGDAVRKAVDDDDAAALRGSASMRYLSQGGGAR